MIRRLFAIPLLALAALSVSADGRTPTPDEVCEAAPTTQVVSIRFEGLRKTRESVLRRAISFELGDTWSEESREQMRRELRSLGLFDRVEISETVARPEEGEIELVVSLRERWTLVPIPFFTSTSSGSSGGLFVLENNLLGFNKQLIAGGAYGTAGFNGIFIYNDPSISGTDIIGGTALTVGRAEQEAVDLDGESIATWESLTSTASLRLGYRISRELDVTTSLSYRADEFSPGLAPPGASEVEAELFNAVSLSWSRVDPLRFFNAGPRGEIEGEYQLTGEIFEERSLRFSLDHDFPLFDGHRFGYALTAEESIRSIWRATSLGGRPTQRTLERGSLPAERYLTGGLSYEIPVYRPDWGTITLLSFYEGGLIHEVGSYHGPGGGFRIYVSRVTLPAVGFDYAYRVPNEQWLFSFSVGMGM